ncbi:MAG: hypothetical protein QW102_00810 [Candidatus Nezhaarchaeales archaeon]
MTVVRGSWRVTVYSTTSGDEIELEVYPTTRVEDLFRTIASVLKIDLNDPEMGYRLVMPGGHKEIGPAHFEKTLAELGIRDGDRLQLIARPTGG